MNTDLLIAKKPEALQVSVSALSALTDQPTLHALSYMLRNSDTWPPGFTWDYSNCTRCAIGMAYTVWSGDEPKTLIGAMISAFRAAEIAPCGINAWLIWAARTFQIPNEAAAALFSEMEPKRRLIGIGRGRSNSVSPLEVADAIDRYLAADH